jgi:murein DD-endopeptidase MepM/ murein hydrolase activator NlpD
VFSGKHLSKFDPHHRGLSRAQKVLQRFFPERQLIVRSGERMRTLRLSTNRQAVLASIGIVLGSWVLLSSSLVMSHSERIRAKNVEIKDARVGYEQLLAQVSIYKERVAELTKDLDDNYKQSLALVDKESDVLTQKAQRLDGTAPRKGLVAKLKTRAQEALTDPAGTIAGDYDNVELALSKAKLDRTHEEQRRKDLLNELAELQDSMVDVVGHHQHTPFIAPDGLELRQVVLERDLALNDRNALTQKVHALEGQIREMESNQLLLYHRFSDVADNKISGIENSLSITGLDIDLLLRQQKVGRGAGGPFIPVNVNSDSENAGPLQETLDALNARMDRLNDLQGLVMRLPLDTPVHNFEINSGFGVRKDPFTGAVSQHLGLDMGAEYKSAVLSPGEGKVVYAGWDGSYGRMVEIDHGMGLVTRYAHLNGFRVKEGDHVSRGTVIGQLGCSGRCSGPHVHYEVLVNGKPVNPLKFLKAGSDVYKK